MILRNLLLYIRNNTKIFIVFLLVQITIVVAFLSVFNYATSLVREDKKAQTECRTYTVTLSDNSRMDKKLSAFYKNYETKIRNLFVIAKTDDSSEVLCEYQYTTGDDGIMIVNGKYFSKKDFESGAKQVLAVFNLDKKKKKNDIIGTQTKSNGEEYTVIGTSVESYPVISYASLKNNDKIFQIRLVMKYDLSNTETSHLIDDLYKNFGDIGIEKPPAYSAKTYSSAVSYISVFGIIVVIALLNIAYLYAYIMNRRLREIAILRICGCSFAETVRRCIAEVVIISIFSYLIALLLHLTVMMPLVIAVTPTQQYDITTTQFILIYLIYLTVEIFSFTPVLKKLSRISYTTLTKE